jgi:hypothetical protein
MQRKKKEPSTRQRIESSKFSDLNEDIDFSYVFADSPSLPEDREFIENVGRKLRATFVNYKTTKRPAYVTYDKFEELKTQFDELTQTIQQMKSDKSSIEVGQAVRETFRELEKVAGIKKIQNCSEEQNLFFSVAIDNVSAALLKKIADVEIGLSRKYPRFSVEIRPVINDEKPDLT